MSTSVLVVDHRSSRIDRLRNALPDDVGSVVSADDIPRTLDDVDRTVLTMVVSLDATDTYPTGIVRLVTKRWPWVSLLLVDAPNTAQLAVTTMKAGAFDYLTEDESDADAIADAVADAHRHTSFGSNGNPLVHPVGAGKLIGTSDAMQPVFERIGVADEHGLNVLLHGESGTGKTLTARAIHAQSSRSGAPYVSVDCRCLSPERARALFFGPDDLPESDGQSPLSVSDLAGGTVVLDHVDAMDAEAQDRLMHVLEARTLAAQSRERASQADVRFIGVMSSAPPPASFRTDLYYHLAELPIGLPPLRERTGDVVPLARHFLRTSNAVDDAEAWSISDAAQSDLRDYPWPGNVRQLGNVIERAVYVASSSTIRADDLILPDASPVPAVSETPAREERAAHSHSTADRPVTAEAAVNGTSTAPSSPELSFGSDGAMLSMEELKKRAVKEAYEKFDGDVDRAAVELDIGRSTMYRMLDRYDLKDD